MQLVSISLCFAAREIPTVCGASLPSAACLFPNPALALPLSPPQLFLTTDFGKTWRNLTEEAEVSAGAPGGGSPGKHGGSQKWLWTPELEDTGGKSSCASNGVTLPQWPNVLMFSPWRRTTSSEILVSAVALSQAWQCLQHLF